MEPPFVSDTLICVIKHLLSAEKSAIESSVSLPAMFDYLNGIDSVIPLCPHIIPLYI